MLAYQDYNPTSPGMGSTPVVLIPAVYANTVTLTAGLTLSWNVVGSRLDLQAVYTGIAWWVCCSLRLAYRRLQYVRRVVKLYVGLMTCEAGKRVSAMRVWCGGYGGDWLWCCGCWAQDWSRHQRRWQHGGTFDDWQLLERGDLLPREQHDRAVPLPECVVRGHRGGSVIGHHQHGCTAVSRHYDHDMESSGEVQGRCVWLSRVCGARLLPGHAAAS